MVGSVFVVLLAFQQIAALNTIDSRRGLEEALSEAPASGLGLTVGAVQQIIHVACLVAGGCAAAAAILGWQVLQRSRSARVALSVLAVPLFVAGFATTGFASSLVAVAVLMLWLQPARAWFAGLEPPTASRSRPTPPSAPVAPASSSSPTPAVSTRAASAPPASAPTPGAHRAGPPTAASVTSMGMWTAEARRSDARRPGRVLAACVVAWVGCGLVAFAMAAIAFTLAVARGPFFDEVERTSPEVLDQGLSQDALVVGIFVVCGVALAWCLAGVALAVAAFNRRRWGQVGLAGSAAAVTVLSLLALLAGNVVALLFVAAGSAVVTLLLHQSSRDWYVGRGGS